MAKRLKKHDLEFPEQDKEGPDWFKPETIEDRNRLICKWSGLAWRVAARFDRSGLGRRWGRMEDFFQEAMLAVHHAVVHFDSEVGVKFVSYAYACIWRWLKRCCSLQGIIRIPVNSVRVSEEDRLSGKFDHLLRLAANAYNVGTLPVSEKGEDRLPDREGFIREEEYHRSLEKCRAALRGLKERQADIVWRRAGVEDEPESLAEIGQRYGISRERVRQIEEASLNKLRNWLKEEPGEGLVARSKMFTGSRKPHPINGTAFSVAPEPFKERKKR